MKFRNYLWPILLIVLLGVTDARLEVISDSTLVQQSVIGETQPATFPATDQVYRQIYSYETGCENQPETYTEWQVTGGINGISYDVLSVVKDGPLGGAYASKMLIRWNKVGSYALTATCRNLDGSYFVEKYSVKVVNVPSNECMPTDTRCLADGMTRQSCVKNSAGVYVWSDSWTCSQANNEKCYAGKCVLQNQCNEGSIRCTSQVYKQDVEKCQLVNGAYRWVKDTVSEGFVCEYDSIVPRYEKYCEGTNSVTYDKLLGEKKVSVCGQCQDGSCTNVCVSNCKVGELKCSDSSYQVCELQGSNCYSFQERPAEVGFCGVQCLSDDDCGGKVCDLSLKKCVANISPPAECLEDGGDITCEGEGVTTRCGEDKGEWKFFGKTACVENGVITYSIILMIILFIVSTYFVLKKGRRK